MSAIIRAALATVMLISASLRAAEPVDWLPPPPVRPPFWDLALPEQPVRMADDFVQILFDRAPAELPAISQPNSGRLKQSREAVLDMAKWKCSVEAPDPRELREIPSLSRDWTAEQSLSLPLPLQESLFMFGQFATGGDIDRTQNRVKGKTGVGWKWSPFTGGEFQVRTGPVVSYEDDVQNRSIEQAQLSVEMQAKLPLFGPLQLQYAGEAFRSPQTVTSTVLQDLKLALPFGTNREVNLGARYRWEDTLTQTPWMQRTELYMGVKIQR